MCRLALGGQTAANLRAFAWEFELVVVESLRKPTQVGGQRKRKFSASRKLALNFASPFGQGVRDQGLDFISRFQQVTLVVLSKTPSQFQSHPVMVLLSFPTLLLQDSRY